ncbi:MAG: YeeE/YedE family protein [Kiloniellales bacterium]
MADLVHARSEPGATHRIRVQRGPLALSLALLAVGVAGLAAQQGWRHGVLFAIGALLGLALYAASFGFTAAYRRLIVRRDASGVYAQLLMLALATILFVPALAEGELFGRPVGGAVAAFSTQVAVGAFLFGLGMQLAGGCGSGTLYTVGGGSARMVVTLVAFCAGGFWASLHMGFWQALPSAGAVSLGTALGWPQAVVVQLGLVAAIAAALWAMTGAAPAAWRGIVRAYWPLILGAVALAVLNFATLAVAGHPWSITWAFTLWGAKSAALMGWDASTSGFWTGGFQGRALGASVFRDNISVMNMGLVLGALAAASLAGRFAPRLRIPPLSLAAAVLGGVLMGYGARIAFGCNIGAFFSGVASTSLHGWLWIVTGFAGNWLGVRLRPHFGLEN